MVEPFGNPGGALVSYPGIGGDRPKGGLDPFPESHQFGIRHRIGVYVFLNPRFLPLSDRPDFNRAY